MDRTPEEFLKESEDTTKPMKNWTRVVIETAEKNPKTLAVVTNNDFELAEGIRVRMKPSNLPYS